MEEGVDGPLAEAEDGSVLASGDGGNRFHWALRRNRALLSRFRSMQIAEGR